MELSHDSTTSLQPRSQQDFHLLVATSSAQADSSKFGPILPIRRHRDLDYHFRAICRLYPWSMSACVKAVEPCCFRPLRGSWYLRKVGLRQRRYETSLVDISPKLNGDQRLMPFATLHSPYSPLHSSKISISHFTKRLRWAC